MFESDGKQSNFFYKPLAIYRFTIENLFSSFKSSEVSVVYCDSFSSPDWIPPEEVCEAGSAAEDWHGRHPAENPLLMCKSWSHQLL